MLTSLVEKAQLTPRGHELAGWEYHLSASHVFLIIKNVLASPGRK